MNASSKFMPAPHTDEQEQEIWDEFHDAIDIIQVEGGYLIFFDESALETWYRQA